VTPLLVADKADIAILDAQVERLQGLVALLERDHAVHAFTRGADLIDQVQAGQALDLVMLDVTTPDADGLAVCRRLRALEEVPIIFMTDQDPPVDLTDSLELGATDHVTRPFVPAIVRNRIGHHVRLGRAMRLIIMQNEQLDQRVAERTAALTRRNAELDRALREISRMQDATIVALSALVEARDTETGQHIQRTQRYVLALAEKLAESPRFAQTLTPDTIDMMAKSAPLHDIGKVAIPDSILRKPGRLDAEEFELMKLHTAHGRRAIEVAEASMGSSHGFLRHARDIAYGHHERWDGLGYPQGLAGDAIPLSARLMALADIYDALISERVYKAAIPHGVAAQMILAQRGKQLDPAVVDAFEAIAPEFAAIAEALSDPP
jgi:putative two-component system response regulator